MENVKYCSSCGTELVGGYHCPKCERQFSNYFAKEIEGRNTSPWEGKYWWKGVAQTYVSHLHLCHACKWFMHHQLEWCPTCGGRVDHRKYTLEEMKQQLASYKEGY